MRVVDVRVVQVASVRRPAHNEHVSVAVVPVVRTQSEKGTSLNSIIPKI